MIAVNHFYFALICIYCYNITKNVNEIWHVLVDNSLYNHCFRVNICHKYTMGYNKSQGYVV